MDPQAAARLGDEIAHGWGLLSMIAGAVIGAVVGAAIIAATAATGGAALVIMAGAVAMGGLSMFSLAKGLCSIFNLPEPTTGALIGGSVNVFINNRSAMRASMDTSASCNGFPFNHPSLPIPITIAQGSAQIFINNLPAARVTSKLMCGAHIKSGSNNVFFGGPTVSTNFVFDLEGWMHTGLEYLGLAALLGGGLLAAIEGLAAFLTFSALTGGGMLAFDGLGQIGDALGPGYRDLLQGIGGMALLLSGPKLAKAEPEAPPRSKAEILAENRRNGAIRENEVATELTNEGHEVLGSQVTVKTPKTNRVVDHLIRDGETGEIRAVEVKSGNAARSSTQIAKDNAMAEEGGEIIGKNAPDWLRGQSMKIPTEVRR